jgi:hypothetical protein
LKKIASKPYCLQKAPLETIDKIQSMINRFSAVCSMILQQEISKYNKEQSDKIRKEMMEMQRKLHDDYEKQMMKLT